MKSPIVTFLDTAKSFDSVSQFGILPELSAYE